MAVACDESLHAHTAAAWSSEGMIRSEDKDRQCAKLRRTLRSSAPRCYASTTETPLSSGLVGRSPATLKSEFLSIMVWTPLRPLCRERCGVSHGDWHVGLQPLPPPAPALRAMGRALPGAARAGRVHARPLADQVKRIGRFEIGS